MKPMDITGNTYGKLTALEYAGKTEGGAALWLFECICGERKVIRAKDAKDGNIVSCGCHRRELFLKHGLHDTPEYSVWCGMKNRCTDENSEYYHNYGGRGIKVCDEWLNDFKRFYEDMGPRPTPDHTIERKDNDGDYSPENCRWATRLEQCHNFRRNRNVTVDGETKCVMEWSRETGVHFNTIRARLNRGVDPKDAISPENTKVVCAPFSKCRLQQLSEGVSSEVVAGGVQPPPVSAGET